LYTVFTRGSRTSTVLENGRLSAEGAAAALKTDPAVRAAYLGAAH
jgi:branched-chain amino acid transport system ATP-binding protein